MKILMVDKCCFIKGGAERYYFELMKILQGHGHQVIPFSMKHPKNYQTPFMKYFVDYIDYDFQNIQKKIINSYRVLGRMLYSLHAKKCLEKIIRDFRPDIAHLHMIDHQLSPSILHTLKKFNIPVLQTVHQYKHICPNYRMYNERSKTICEKCLDGNYFHPIFERCHKNSIGAGILLTLEAYFHRMMKIYEKNVDLFHIPSRFMGLKLQERGIAEEKLFHLHYTINLKDYRPNYDAEEYIVYCGRLSEEKGILTLLKAMRDVSNVNLILVGDGPQRSQLELYVNRHQLKLVRFLGYRSGEELKSILSRSRFLIVPSEWYDNSPLVIYEAFALGKPVIGSNLGGIPELIDDQENGLIFQAGHEKELAECIKILIKNPHLIKKMGRKARKKAEMYFDPDYHYNQLMLRYREMINNRKSEHGK